MRARVPSNPELGQEVRGQARRDGSSAGAAPRRGLPGRRVGRRETLRMARRGALNKGRAEELLAALFLLFVALLLALGVLLPLRRLLLVFLGGDGLGGRGGEGESRRA